MVWINKAPSGDGLKGTRTHLFLWNVFSLKKSQENKYYLYSWQVSGPHNFLIFWIRSWLSCSYSSQHSEPTLYKTEAFGIGTKCPS